MTSMKADIAALLDAVIAEGLVACGEALWLDKRGPDRHWRLTYVPVRDEANSWYLHTMLQEISARDYQDQLETTGRDIQITRVKPDAS